MHFQHFRQNAPATPGRGVEFRIDNDYEYVVRKPDLNPVVLISRDRDDIQLRWTYVNERRSCRVKILIERRGGTNKIPLKVKLSVKGPEKGSDRTKAPPISGVPGVGEFDEQCSFWPFRQTSVSLNLHYFLYLLHSVQFSKHLNEIVPNRLKEGPEVGGIVNVDLGRLKWEPTKDVSSKKLVVVDNLLASRVFYGFYRDAYWCNAVKQKVRPKLATLHLPYFIETLELSGFDIGTAIPKSRNIYAPVVDEWGLWMDFEMHYEGCIKLSLETRVISVKLNEQHDSLTDPSTAAAVASSLPSSMTAIRVSRLSDHEAEISPETSPDEVFGSKIELSNNGHTKKKKTGEKLLSLVDKIAQSSFFREASERRPIRKMLEEISSTRLILSVEVTALEGPATINLPPPPLDRLWYGFRKPPTRMSVHAVPQVGDRSAVFSTLSEWIESKTVVLFEKNLVMPNLDDIVMTVMCGNELLQGSISR